jgi:arginyl-tRNA--protein-N-Asp/Glu arginylyltransferase
LYQTIVGRIDKQLIGDAALLRIKGAGFHRTNAIAAEEYRIARRQLTRFITLQQNTDPFSIRRSQRRRIQQRETGGLPAFRPRLQFNIGAGQQRPESADPFTSYLRFDDPKTESSCNSFFMPAFSRALISTWVRSSVSVALSTPRHPRCGF